MDAVFDVLVADKGQFRGIADDHPLAEGAADITLRILQRGHQVVPLVVLENARVRYEIDTKTLSSIASITEGDFYRATNTKELRNIYKEIDKLEKSKLNVKKFSKRYEAYQPFALAAVLALLLEILLRITIFRRIP